MKAAQLEEELPEEVHDAERGMARVPRLKRFCSRLERQPIIG